MSEDKIIDPKDILKLVADLYSGKSVDREAARKAVEQAFRDHNFQLRVFLAACAKSKLNRIMRCMEFVESVEARLFREDQLQDATTSQLVRLYAFTQGSIHTDLEFIQGIVNTNIEIQKLLGSINPDNAALKGELDALPELSQESRTRMRESLQRCFNILKDSEERDKTLLIDATSPKELDD